MAEGNGVTGGKVIDLMAALKASMAEGKPVGHDTGASSAGSDRGTVPRETGDARTPLTSAPPVSTPGAIFRDFLEELARERIEKREQSFFRLSVAEDVELLAQILEPFLVDDRPAAPELTVDHIKRRLAVFALDIDGFDSLSEHEQELLTDCAVWMRRELDKGGDYGVSEMELHNGAVEIDDGGRVRKSTVLREPEPECVGVAPRSAIAELSRHDPLARRALDVVTVAIERALKENDYVIRDGTYPHQLAETALRALSPDINPDARAALRLPAALAALLENKLPLLGSNQDSPDPESHGKGDLEG